MPGRPLPALRWLILLTALAPVATASLLACSTQPRAPAWTCMQRTVDELSFEGMVNLRRHCVAAGTIAIRCGTLSALAAGYGKEVADLFGPGLVQAADIEANAAGRACAARGVSEDALPQCCAGADF